MARVVRIAVMQDGKERKLAKITESASGQLVITNELFSPVPGASCDDLVLSEKITVHLSEKAQVPMRSLHAHQKTADGEQDAYAHLPIIADADFVYPAFARLVSRLTSSRYDIGEDEKQDETVPLVSYDSSGQTLLNFGWITNADTVLPALSGLRKIVIRFQKFALVIYYTFSSKALPYASANWNMATKPVKKNGVFEEGETIMIDRPMVLEAVNPVTFDMARFVVNMVRDKAEAFYKARNQPNRLPHFDQWEFEANGRPADTEYQNYGVYGGFIILNGDPKQILEHYSQIVRYLRYTEYGSIDDIISEIKNSVCYAGPVFWDDLEKAAGGSVKDYLCASIDVA